MSSNEGVMPVPVGVRDVPPNGVRKASAFLFARLAFQNLLRQPTRTMLLILAVAMGTGAVFASFTVACGIERSMAASFARMGADLIVVPDKTLVNITSALLTVQPTEEQLDRTILAEVGKLPGVVQVTPQTIYRIPIMAGMPDCKANLVAFDPQSDFTVMPWLAERMPRAMATGDVVCGGCRTEMPADEIQVCNVSAPVYGKLSRSGVGPLDDSFFTTYDTIKAIAASGNADPRSVRELHRQGISAVLVRLDFGATAEQVRFAIARIPGVKVVTGTRIVTATRQTTTVLLAGMIGLTVVMLIGSLILVSLLFSAIIAERRREIGLLRAIGCRRANILRMLVAEAGLATGLGGLLGIVLGSGLLLLFQHSLVYYLETLHIEFAWPAPHIVAITALVCAAASALVGLFGALVPAWQASGEEPQILLHGGSRSC